MGRQPTEFKRRQSRSHCRFVEDMELIALMTNSNQEMLSIQMCLMHSDETLTTRC